jgi:hypothetical protein
VSLPETCPSCGQPRLTRYCANCGERAIAPDDLSLKRFFRSLGEELLPGFGDEDEQGLKRAGGRVYRTVYTLLRYPGRMTADYFVGRRRPYMKPVQVYVALSVIFFLVGTNYFRYELGDYEYVPGIGETKELIEREAQRRRTSVESYSEVFDRRITAQKKTMIAVLIPLLALGMVPLIPRRKYGEHLIFSIHAFAFMMLFLGVIVKLFFYVVFVILRVVPLEREVVSTIGAALDNEFIFVSLIYLGYMLYLRAALRVVYGGRPLTPLWRALALTVVHAFLIVFVFRLGLFYTTFYSLKWLS